MAHVSGDRVRSELFQQPRYDTQENSIVHHIMNYMTEEFLSAGVSVVYDANVSRTGQRRMLKDLALKNRADFLLVWLQVDSDTAFNRTQRRDRRTSDDRFAQEQTRESFDKVVSEMQNPQPNESYMVISGKHSFITQKNAIINRLYQSGLISSEVVQQNVAKPELINLVPNPYSGRVDATHRNIPIS